MSRLVPAPTIYVVDDDPEVRSSVELLLSAVGMRVQGFSDGASFIEEQKCITPGVLLLDLNMPGLDGLGVLRGLMEGFRAVIHSGRLEPSLAKEAKLLGVIDVLQKPCEPRELIRRLSLASATLHRGVTARGKPIVSP